MSSVVSFYRSNEFSKELTIECIVWHIPITSDELHHFTVNSNWPQMSHDNRWVRGLSSSKVNSLWPVTRYSSFFDGFRANFEFRPSPWHQVQIDASAFKFCGVQVLYLRNTYSNLTARTNLTSWRLTVSRQFN